MQQTFQRLVGYTVGAGFVKDDFTFGAAHHRRPACDLANALVDFAHLVKLRRPDQVQHLCLRLNHVGRSASGVGDRIVDPRLRNDMLPQIIDADIHQFHRIQRTAAQMRRSGGMSAAAVETKIHLKIGQRANRHDAVVPERVPGESDIQRIEDAGPRHESFARTAFLAGTTVIANRPCQAGFGNKPLHSHRRRQCPCPQQVMTATMTVSIRRNRFLAGKRRFLAQPRQRVIFTKKTDNRTAAAKTGDKSGRQPRHRLLHLKSFASQRINQQLTRAELLKPHLGKLPYFIAERDKIGLLIVDELIHCSLIPHLLHPAF